MPSVDGTDQLLGNLVEVIPHCRIAGKTGHQLVGQNRPLQMVHE